jgi:8-oxo-dGTP pyrophosphatase MutT (NUDIX family)
MKHTFSAGGVVLNPLGQVLVVSQHGTSWSLPKGHIEPTEKPKAAAAREIEEESGISKLVFIKELGSYQRHNITKDGNDDTSELKTITIFMYRTDDSDLNPIDAENPEARWVDVDKVTGLLTHQKDKKFFEEIKNRLN